MDEEKVKNDEIFGFRKKNYQSRLFGIEFKREFSRILEKNKIVKIKNF